MSRREPARRTVQYWRERTVNQPPAGGATPMSSRGRTRVGQESAGAGRREEGGRVGTVAQEENRNAEGGHNGSYVMSSPTAHHKREQRKRVILTNNSVIVNCHGRQMPRVMLVPHTSQPRRMG